MMTEIRRSIAWSPRKTLSLRLRITDCSESIEVEKVLTPQEEGEGTAADSNEEEWE